MKTRGKKVGSGRWTNEDVLRELDAIKSATAAALTATSRDLKNLREFAEHLQAARLSDLQEKFKAERLTTMLEDRREMAGRNHMESEEFYSALDPGIRFAVEVLHAAGGIETCQSCAGSGSFGKGSGKIDIDSHSYDRPTIDMLAGGDDAIGFKALAILQDYGLPVRDLQLVWNIKNGLPYEKLWRVTFWKAFPERACEKPMFVYSYRAQ